MPGHLVVVVHGIGEQQAGETADSVLAGAIADHEKQAGHEPVFIETEIIEIPQRPFIGDELDQDSKKEDREVHHFPMHLRHVSPADCSDPSKRTTFVDMYWADISPAPTGLWRTVVDLVRTLLGVGYLALGNVRSHGTRFSYGLVRAFVWVFFTVIASINMMLLTGLGLLLLEGVAYDIVERLPGTPFVSYKTDPGDGSHFEVWQEVILIANSILTVLLGYLLNRYGPKTQLMKQFARGLVSVGFLSFLFGMITLDQPDLAERMSGLQQATDTALPSDRHIDTELRIGPPLSTDDAAEEPPNYLTHFVRIAVRVLNFSWIVALLCCMAMYATTYCEVHGLGTGRKNWRNVQAKRWDKKYARRMENFAAADWAEENPKASKAEEAAHRDRKPEPDGPVRIYASICSALILLWMVFASSFWLFVEWVIGNPEKIPQGSDNGVATSQTDATAVGRGAPETAASNAREGATSNVDDADSDVQSKFSFDLADLLQTELAQALGGMTVGVALFCLLLITGAIIATKRGRMAKEGVLHLNLAESDRHRRILLHSWIQVVFFISTPVIFVTASAHFIEINGMGEIEILGWIVDQAQNWDGIASLALLVIAALIYFLHDAIGRALGVIRDITVYSTTEDVEPFPKKRDWVEKDEEEQEKAEEPEKRDQGPGDGDAIPSRPENFPTRHKIETRFERVLDFMIWSQQPEHVTIVSHSLGTVVATRSLGRWLADKSLPNGVLVTMGSPVTHIYRRYFPQFFDIQEPLLRKMRWINIFRRDDFVGTYVAGPPLRLEGKVENIDVAAGGHSGYFTDEVVWRHLRLKAGLWLLGRPASLEESGPSGSGGEDRVTQDEDADPPGGEDDRAGRHLSKA